MPCPCVEGLRRGDPSALQYAYETHKQAILGAASAVLGRHVDGSWDVLHDVFVALARRAPKIGSDVNLRAYLVRSAVNRATDYLRRRATVPLPSDMPAAGPGVIESAAHNEQAIALWQQMASLPDEQRVIVALRIWGGLSFAEIARDQGISENTAQSRYRYALNKLRGHYQVAQNPQGVQP
jgi:RNA polymerase sigma-70 factor (ECF subfamily)